MINSASLALLVISVLLGWPLRSTLVAAVGVGVGLHLGRLRRPRPVEPPAARTRRCCNTAFAFEAVLDEVVFIVGPVLVTFLATAIHPALGRRVSAVHRTGRRACCSPPSARTQPPVHAAAPRRRGAIAGCRCGCCSRSPWPAWRWARCSAAWRSWSSPSPRKPACCRYAGCLDVLGLRLAAGRRGHRDHRLAGSPGHPVPDRRGRAGRCRCCRCRSSTSRCRSPRCCWCSAGWPSRPTLIASVAVTQAAVPATRLTEALDWTSTGLAVGLAAGAAVSGS